MLSVYMRPGPLRPIGSGAAGGGPAGRTGPSWDRVKATFLAAIEEAPASWPSFLDHACAGDQALRAEVEALLASDRAAGSFGDRPAAELLGLAGCGNEIADGAIEPALPPGTRLGGFEVVSLIGTGGMGRVYLARDPRLDRQVAIKTVGRDASDASARSALLREARHASRLSHPNICAIHEVGEQDGIPFIVMEYVDGRPLLALAREGPMARDRALALAGQIAAAVAHAHERGIVHRDLKSSNIIVTEDRGAVVLDFGLARRLPDEDGRPTETSLGPPFGLAGTLSYMAPEVLRGAYGDARSDVWALGVLLYEMLTGELPFTGRTSFEISSSILHDPPGKPPRRLPVAVRLVLQRCLAKDPAKRYQRAADVHAALDRARRRGLWSGADAVRVYRRHLAAGVLVAAAVVAAWLGGTMRWPAPPVADPASSTLAVLPIESGASGDEAYYADAFTAALIGELGAMNRLRVISWTSTRRYRGAGRLAAEVGRELGAGMVVQGTLRRAGDRLDLEVRLVDASDGRLIWSDRYERHAREVLALQADVVRGVADRLVATLTPEARARQTTVRAVSPDVYEAYLQGRYQWHLRTPASMRAAIAHFERAIELDPTYAPAHAGLADCYNQFGTVNVGGGPPAVWRPRAAAAAIKALQLDPALAEAHAALGFVRHYQWQWEEAERLLRRALELNPSLALARIWYANLLMSRGRFDEALREATAAGEIDPFSAVVTANVGWVLTYARRYEEAEAVLRRAVELDPAYPTAHYRLADVLAALGRFDEAEPHVRRNAELSGGTGSTSAALAMLDARRGNHEQAQQALKTLLAGLPDHYVPPSTIAHIHLALGQMDGALAWLERAYDEGSNFIAYLAVDPGMDPLRGQPRYERLLERVGLR